jgi:hypothetical protein
MPLSRLAAAWLPVLLWAGLIFGFSAVPDLGTGLGTWDLVLRKIAHFCEYAVLGLLLMRATRREGVAVGLGVLYAASDELHQHFVPGRQAAVRKDVGDRQLDALLERLDRLVAEVHGLNRRLDAGENLAPLVYELRALNESLSALAYAALGQQGPQVRRRRAS